MNDLTKEAISRELNPDRPLTGEPEHYLTGYEGARCDRLDVLPKPDPRLEIDAFMDGHSEGMAAGMTLMDQSMEEARTGINLDKINRVSDEYRKISDEVEQEIGE